MKTLIAVPCLDTVHTAFMVSLLKLNKPAGTEIAVSSSSLVYDARHSLAHRAIQLGAGRILWLDSDMMFAPDLLERLSADLDQGLEFVSGLYFTRKAPVTPCVYEICHDVGGVPTAAPFTSIPDGLFEAEGVGFGAVLMDTRLVCRVGQLPFFPMEGYGEDLSFCRRARAAGAKIFCDSRVRVDHIGLSLFNETQWKEASE